MVKRGGIFFLAVFFWWAGNILGLPRAIGQPQTEEVIIGNKGNIYSNPGLSKKRPKDRAVEAPVQAPVQTSVSRQKPQVVERTEEPKAEPRREEGPQPQTEQPMVTKDAAELEARFQEALSQLFLAYKKIEELQSRIPEAGFTQTYMVKKGETLWSIAAKKEIYNDPYKWLLLYHANRDQIFDPNLIYPGMILMIPHLPEYGEDKAKS
jgi:nucleoid-associated protein YgaU